MATTTTINNNSTTHTTVEWGDLVSCTSEFGVDHVLMAVPVKGERETLTFICVSSSDDDESFVRYYDHHTFGNGEHADNIKTLEYMKHFKVYKNSKISIELAE